MCELLLLGRRYVRAKAQGRLFWLDQSTLGNPRQNKQNRDLTARLCLGFHRPNVCALWYIVGTHTQVFLPSRDCDPNTDWWVSPAPVDPLVRILERCLEA